MMPLGLTQPAPTDPCSARTGTPYVHQFCLCAVNSIVSPFVLFEIAGEVGSYLSRNNTAPPYRSQVSHRGLRAVTEGLGQ